jgi:BASS family bile acid:Na+ symporter
MAIRDILQNNALMMLFAFILGFAIGGFPAHNADIAMACLVIVMSLSLGGLKIRGMRLREHTKSVIVALVACFGVSSIVTILLGSLFSDADIRIGWVIVASVPSAIAVIPFTYLLKGDLQFSLVASTVIYVLSLVITPLMTLLFLGRPVDQLTLLWYVIILIFLPLAASRALVKVPMSGQMRTILINIAFFVMFFAITGSNRNAFFGDPILIFALLLVATVRTFFVGGAVEFIARRLRVEKKKRIPIVLFSTYKNTGMAAALASVLIGSVAAIPATVCLAMEVIWFVALTKAIYPMKEK